jgi:hypothetical protein
MTCTFDSSSVQLYLHSPKTEEPLCELFLRVTKATDNFKVGALTRNTQIVMDFKIPCNSHMSGKFPSSFEILLVARVPAIWDPLVIT